MTGVWDRKWRSLGDDGLDFSQLGGWGPVGRWGIIETPPFCALIYPFCSQIGMAYVGVIVAELCAAAEADIVVCWGVGEVESTDWAGIVGCAGVVCDPHIVLTFFPHVEGLVIVGWWGVLGLRWLQRRRVQLSRT